MSDPIHPDPAQPDPAQPDPAQPDPAQPDTAHFQRILAALIDRTAATAHKLADRIDAETTTPAEIARLAAALERVATIVRRSIVLSIHLTKTAEQAAATRTAARIRIIREISDTIARENLAPDRAETLRVELVERLDAPDLAPHMDREIAFRPVADIILDLKRDMGLGRLPGTPKWPRRTPDDIADLLARAYAPPARHHPTPF